MTASPDTKNLLATFNEHAIKMFTPHVRSCGWAYKVTTDLVSDHPDQESLVQELQDRGFKPKLGLVERVSGRVTNVYLEVLVKATNFTVNGKKCRLVLKENLIKLDITNCPFKTEKLIKDLVSVMGVPVLIDTKGRFPVVLFKELNSDDYFHIKKIDVPIEFGRTWTVNFTWFRITSSRTYKIEVKEKTNPQDEKKNEECEKEFVVVLHKKGNKKGKKSKTQRSNRDQNVPKKGRMYEVTSAYKDKRDDIKNNKNRALKIHKEEANKAREKEAELKAAQEKTELEKAKSNQQKESTNNDESNSKENDKKDDDNVTILVADEMEIEDLSGQ